VVALLVTLVPAHLLELRYFTPAVIIAVINLPEIGKGGIDDNDLSGEKRNFKVNMKNEFNDNNIIASKGIEYRNYCILMSICCCCVINMITIYVFLYKSFIWNDGSIARFMY
jgi:hypothetical protein